MCECTFYGINSIGRITKVDAYHAPFYPASLCIDNHNIIWNVHTRTDCLRKGLMTKLFKFILNWNAEYTLFVDPGNTPAVNLYTKLGFRFIECDKMKFKRFK